MKHDLSLKMPRQVLASDMAPANYFVDHVSKAYASLTNPTAMAAFEKFGHPDGAEVSGSCKAWIRDMTGHHHLYPFEPKLSAPPTRFLVFPMCDVWKCSR